MKIANVLVMGHEKNLTEVFESRGLTVILVNNIFEVKAALQDYHFDVVVADISTSDMNDGLKVAKMVYQSLPFIAIGPDQSCLEKFSNICDCLIERVEIEERLYKAAMKAIERRNMGIAFAA